MRKISISNFAAGSVETMMCERLARGHALLRAITFDRQTAEAVGLVEPHPRQLPVGRALAGVLLLDQVAGLPQADLRKGSRARE